MATPIMHPFQKIGYKKCLLALVLFPECIPEMHSGNANKAAAFGIPSLKLHAAISQGIYSEHILQAFQKYFKNILKISDLLRDAILRAEKIRIAGIFEIACCNFARNLFLQNKKFENVGFVGFAPRPPL